MPISAHAQEWEYRLTLYGWFAGLDSSVDTPFGTVDAELSFDDVLSDLDMAFMGAVEARRDRWGLIADLVYADVSLSRSNLLGGAISGVTVEPQLTTATGLVAYRVYDQQATAIDIAAGLRYVKLDTEVRFASGLTFGGEQDWTNPVLGVRLSGNFDDRWYGRAYADIGGWDGNSTWQVMAAVGYRFSPTWSAEFGYRHMEFETDLNRADMSLDMSGPMLGISARF